jgi:hypothetical protein
LYDILQLPSVSKLDIFKAVRHLTSSKSLRLDGVPGLIIIGCATVVEQVFKYIFDLSVLWDRFPTQWEKVIMVPSFQKGNSSSDSNYR